MIPHATIFILLLSEGRVTVLSTTTNKQLRTLVVGQVGVSRTLASGIFKC